MTRIYKYDFTLEERKDALYILDVKPNDQLEMKFPCEVLNINTIAIKTEKEFREAYKKAAETDTRFLLGTKYDGKITYYGLLVK